MLLITLLSDVQNEKTNSKLQTKKMTKKKYHVCPTTLQKSGGFYAPENACMQSINQISQSVSRLNAKELKILPFSLRCAPLPLSFPEAEYPHVCYVPYFSN